MVEWVFNIAQNGELQAYMVGGGVPGAERMASCDELGLLCMVDKLRAAFQQALQHDATHGHAAGHQGHLCQSRKLKLVPFSGIH